jgi:hypothetical protein
MKNDQKKNPGWIVGYLEWEPLKKQMEWTTNGMNERGRKKQS